MKFLGILLILIGAASLIAQHFGVEPAMINSTLTKWGVAEHGKTIRISILGIGGLLFLIGMMIGRKSHM